MINPLLIALGVGVGAYLLLKPKGPAASPPGTLQVPPTTIYGSPSQASSPGETTLPGGGSVDYTTGPDTQGGDIQTNTSSQQGAVYTQTAPIGETLGQPVYPDTTQTSGLAEAAAAQAMADGHALVGGESDAASLAALQASSTEHHYQTAGGWPHLRSRSRKR